MHAVMGWARASALPSLCLLVVACVDGESAAVGELEARAATASEGRNKE